MAAMYSSLSLVIPLPTSDSASGRVAASSSLHRLPPSFMADCTKDSSGQCTDATTFDFGTRLGLVFVVEAAGLSAIAVLGLLGYIAVRPLIPLSINLLLSMIPSVNSTVLQG